MEIIYFGQKNKKIATKQESNFRISGQKIDTRQGTINPLGKTGLVVR